VSEKSKRTTMSIAAMEGQLVPEQYTYQAQLRAAMAGAVGEADVTAVVKQIVEGAKSGDRNAQKLFFEYLLGTKNQPTKITINQQFPDVEAAARHERDARRLNGHRGRQLEN